MYGQAAKQSNVGLGEQYPSMEKEKALVALSGRYGSALNEQEKLIEEIRQKVSSIFNKKTVSTPGDTMPTTPPIDDFVSELSAKIDRLYSHNYMLSNIANQLSELI